MTVGILKILKIWDMTLSQFSVSEFDTATYSVRFCDFVANPITGQLERHTNFTATLR